MCKSIKYGNETFIFYINQKFISTLYYNKLAVTWHISFYDKSTINVKTYNINNIINLTPEEYFQESLIWDYPFPFESAYKIINKAHKNNNRFNIFDHSTNYYIEE